MSTTHTQGDWELLRQGVELQSHPDEASHWIQAYPPGYDFGITVAELPISATHEHDGSKTHNLTQAESLANGRLMAASPDLLAACLEAAKLLNYGPVGAQLSAAIAKATTQ